MAFFWLGGLPGFAIDADTGAMYNLSTNDVFAELKSSSTSLDKTKDGLYIAVVLKPNTNWVKIGQLEKIGH